MHHRRNKTVFLFMNSKKLLFMFCMMFLTLFVTGCAASQHSEDELGEKLADFKADIKKVSGNEQEENKNLCIGSVNMGFNSEWFSEAMNGIQDASDDLGITVKMLDSGNSMEKERENVRYLVKDGIDALVISTRDYNESVKSLKPAIDAGIPIITWNTSAAEGVTSFICVDSKALGANTGDYLCEYIKTYDLKDVNLMIIGNQNYDIGVARCDGFKEAIRNMVDTGIVKIVAEDYAEDFDAGTETVGRLLKEHPETTVIWAWNQPSLLGTIDAVKKAGRTDIVVMGTDMSMELAQDMLSSDVNLLSITTQMPYNMGYKAVVTAVKAIHKEDVDKKVFVPLFTYTKEDKELIERYIKAHKKLAEFHGGQWYE